ncbi:MAG: UdgX family uracil-DNA binding protein [Deltaproteobacteria bacterium]|nr:UdgX family uracil-DNA binding protein [Deltaproteobacteria bacterium]
MRPGGDGPAPFEPPLHRDRRRRLRRPRGPHGRPARSREAQESAPHDARQPVLDPGCARGKGVELRTLFPGAAGRVPVKEPWPTAAAFLPEGSQTLEKLREAATGCRGCDLWERGTQTVFGAGRPGARVLFVGEQPGNDEDRKGLPFVGPAGRVLDQAMDEAGIDRSAAYVTNVVKHFKWVQKGKLRIHQKPSSREIGACLPWLQAEMELVRPEVLVCLGATAAQALLGRDFRVTRQRGILLEREGGPRYLATVHPSSILRAPDDDARREQQELFVEDLRKVAAAIAR